MEQNNLILFQELETDKKRYVDTIDKVIEAAKEIENRIQFTEKIEGEREQLKRLYDESQWYLGEERNKRGQLEHDLNQSWGRCEALECELNQLRMQLNTVQKNLEEAQWFLGEERAKHA